MIPGNASHVRVIDVQVALTRPIVHLASSHIAGVIFVNLIVLGASAGATEKMVALVGVQTQTITTVTIQRRKDMNAFDALTNVKHV